MAPINGPGQGRAQALVAANVLFLVLPWPFVAMRIWARLIKRVSLTFNDYSIIAALIFTSGFNINVIVATIKGGYGQHITALTMDELTANQKSTIASTTLWPTAVMLIKVSVLHFYKSIFRNRKMNWTVYIVGTITVAFWLATILAAFLICTPFEYNWNKVTITGHCGDLIKYYLSTGIVNLLIDVIIVALPLPILWGLQMDVTRKISLTAIFSLGALICGISIVRVYAIATLNLTDATYNIVLDNTMTSLEPTLGVINACLPLLQPVVSKIPGGSVISWLKSLRSGGTSRRGLFSSEGKKESKNSENSAINKRVEFKRYSGDNSLLTDGDSQKSGSRKSDASREV